MSELPCRPPGKRPYFEVSEIEEWAARELDALSLLPSSPGPIRIERFVERRFALGAVSYEPLPTGVLGFTVFGEQGVKEVVVARQLVEDDSRVADRRVRTTLAHEAGHGLMHSELFAPGGEPLSLFDEDSDVTRHRILCRDQPRGPGYRGRWWEYQANLMMAALLLPKTLVTLAVADLTAPQGLLGPTVVPDDRRDEAVLLLSDLFDVNPIVARYRLEALFPRPDGKQLTL